MFIKPFFTDYTPSINLITISIKMGAYFKYDAGTPN